MEVRCRLHIQQINCCKESRQLPHLPVHLVVYHTDNPSNINPGAISLKESLFLAQTVHFTNYWTWDGLTVGRELVSSNTFILLSPYSPPICPPFPFYILDFATNGIKGGCKLYWIARNALGSGWSCYCEKKKRQFKARSQPLLFRLSLR